MMEKVGKTRHGFRIAGVLAALFSMAGFAEEGRPWLAEETIPAQTVTEALNGIWALAPENAGREVGRIEASLEGASAQGKLAGGLLKAAALERAGQVDGALSAYRELADLPAGSPYKKAASTRVRLHEAAGSVDKPDLKKLERTFKAMGAEPSSPGWFLVAGEWTYQDSRRAAWESLVNLRRDWLSFRFFSAIRSHSTFPMEYSYLFVLLVLTAGVSVVTLPLLFRVARLRAQFRRVMPEIRAIHSIYGTDLAARQAALAQLYNDRGINVMAGCAGPVVNIIFVIWMLLSARSYVPQMLLDGSRLAWLNDVTRFDAPVILVWMSVGVVEALLNRTGQAQLGQTTGGVVISAVFSGGVILALAWFWQWPAYVFIFWTLLSVISGLTIGVLSFIAASRA